MPRSFRLKGLDGVERTATEDSNVPFGVQVFCRAGQILGNSPIGSMEGPPAQYDEVRLSPPDYEWFAKTQAHRPDAPAARRGANRKLS